MEEKLNEMTVIINRLQDIGRAEHILIELASEEWTDKLSKHDPYWFEDPSVTKLDECRHKLKRIHEKLWDAIKYLRKEE